jgi:hypothetical protein
MEIERVERHKSFSGKVDLFNWSINVSRRSEPCDNEFTGKTSGMVNSQQRSMAIVNGVRLKTREDICRDRGFRILG